MKNEGKSEQLRVLIARINKNLEDIENLDMASLSPWWPTLSEKALAINEDLRILLPLAAEVQPAMAKEILTLKEAVVNMRISSYNLMNDMAMEAAGRPVPQEWEGCEAMKAHGIFACPAVRAFGTSTPEELRAIEFCINECRHQTRCLANEPAGGDN